MFGKYEQMTFLTFFLLCCADETSNVHQSALALLGDLAKVNITLHLMDCPSDLVKQVTLYHYVYWNNVWGALIM